MRRTASHVRQSQSPQLNFMSDDWQPSAEEFNLFLRWLDPDADKAAQRYEEMRRNLIGIFNRRNCHLAEDLADKTFNRVMRRLPKMIDTYVGEPARYITVVARNLYLEYVEQTGHQEALPETDHTRLSAAVYDDEKEHQFACLEHCLDRLTSDNRRLVLDYYYEDKRAKIDNRRLMAERLGIAINALRIRAHRIRNTLEECLAECLAEDKSL